MSYVHSMGSTSGTVIILKKKKFIIKDALPYIIYRWLKSARENTDKDMSCVKFDGYKYIGHLSTNPSIHLVGQQGKFTIICLQQES